MSSQLGIGGHHGEGTLTCLLDDAGIAHHVEVLQSALQPCTAPPPPGRRRRGGAGRARRARSRRPHRRCAGDAGNDPPTSADESKKKAMPAAPAAAHATAELVELGDAETSASSTIIVEALGTSTPTSMTAAETSRSISPLRAICAITSCFSSPVRRPWRMPSRAPANSTASARRCAVWVSAVRARASAASRCRSHRAPAGPVRRPQPRSMRAQSPTPGAPAIPPRWRAARIRSPTSG